MDAHDLLGLPPSATLADAEDAYRRLLRRHHPDLHQHEGPDAVAAAELRTRALNAAIRDLRRRLPAESVASQRARRPAGAGTSATGGPSPSWDPFASGAWDTAPGADIGHDRPAVACPLCDEEFTTAGSLKAHVLVAHEMHLDPRRRRKVRRRRPASASWPLTLLVPVNASFALLIAAAVNLVLESPALSTWVFALTMAPSAIRLFTQD